MMTTITQVQLQSSPRLNTALYTVAITLLTNLCLKIDNVLDIFKISSTSKLFCTL